MIKLEHTDVFGFEAAIRGMRNPMNSWDKSDSHWCDHIPYGYIPEDRPHCGGFGSYCIGHNDLKLMKNLSKAGNDHAKFLRMINVTVDITAPMYFWKQFDQYRVAVTTNSTSTMHKIHAKEFTLDDFSHNHLEGSYSDGCPLDGIFKGIVTSPIGMLNLVIDVLNICRERYLKTKDKKYWWQMIQLLPSSYNQKRTVQLNYQVLKSMYFARRHHKLDEWVKFCKWCETLPYFKEVCIDA